LGSRPAQYTVPDKANFFEYMLKAMRNSMPPLVFKGNIVQNECRQDLPRQPMGTGQSFASEHKNQSKFFESSVQMIMRTGSKFHGKTGPSPFDSITCSKKLCNLQGQE